MVDEIQNTAAATPPAEKPKSILNNLDAFRLPSDFKASTTVERRTTVRVGRPDKAWFFQIHPTSHFDGLIYRDQSDMGATEYLVAQAMYAALDGHGRQVRIHLGVTAQPTPPIVFLWPVSLPQADEKGRVNSWVESAHIAVEEAQQGWISLRSDRALSCYTIHKPMSPTMTSPMWPKESFEDLLGIAFRDRMIVDENHPIVQALQGRNL